MQTGGRISHAHRLIAQKIGGALSKLVEHEAGPGIVQKVQVVEPANPLWQILYARHLCSYLIDMTEGCQAR